MIAFLIGVIALVIHLGLKWNKEKTDPVDFVGLVGILAIIWGMSRYYGVGPKPMWDPN
jgi:hypothetical protein